jgi:hypothetical protein
VVETVRDWTWAVLLTRLPLATVIAQAVGAIGETMRIRAAGRSAFLGTASDLTRLLSGRYSLQLAYDPEQASSRYVAVLAAIA